MIHFTAAVRAAHRHRRAPAAAWRVARAALDDRDAQPRQLQQRRDVSASLPREWWDWRAAAARAGATGSLVVDDAAHRGAVRAAAADGSLSFGFSAGGCLFPYYVGVVAALQDAEIMTDKTQLGGASAGSLIAACVASGLPPADIAALCGELMDDLRARGTRGRLGPVLRGFLEAHLPARAHEACSGRVHVAVTRIGRPGLLRPVLVSQFTDRADLISALATSCHIPYWLDGQPTTVFRGAPHLDGGLTNFTPAPPGTTCVRVTCFPASALSPVLRFGIAPDRFGEWPHGLSTMLAWAFEPATPAEIEALIDKGRGDAVAWARDMGLERAAAAADAAAAEGRGAAAAAAAAAAGTADAGEQRRLREEGWRELEARAEAAEKADVPPAQ